MTCSPKQRKLIEDLMEEGALIPAHPHSDQPDFSMFDSVQAADKYIKDNYHHLNRKIALIATSKRLRPDDWGGIPNH